MKLRTKLVGGFALVAAFTLGLSVFAYWEVQRLSAALFEVGVVRLPSIQGLNLMSEAMLTLDAAGRAQVASGHGVEWIESERVRQEKGWRQFERGWSLYEPLPQTAPEALVWEQFVRSAATWRESYASVFPKAASPLGQAARVLPDSSGRDGKWNATTQTFAETYRLLGELTAINYAIADEATRQSISRRQDVTRLRRVMLWAGATGVFGAMGLGLLLGRAISRPMVKIARALARISQGDLSAQVDEGAVDEIGEIARALNRMAEGLRTGEARLRVLSDNLPDSVVYQIMREEDGSMRFIYASACVERLHGFSPAELLQDASLYYNQIVDEDRARVIAARERSMRDLSPFTLNVQIRRADGTMRWMHMSSAPRRLPDERIVWDGIETDFTDRKLDQARLDESEVRFRAVFDHSLDAIGVSREGHLVFVNPAFPRLFGFVNAAAAVGRTVLDLIAPESRDLVRDRIRRRELGETLPASYELRGLRQDGSVFEMEVHSSVFSVAGVRYVIALHRDITERKRIDAEIRKANRALKTIRECHQLLVHATSELPLLREVCSVIVGSGGYRAAWVGFAEQGLDKNVRPVAQAGGSDEDFLKLTLSWADADSGRGPTGTAIRTGQPTLCRDFRSDPAVACWREEAIRRGFNSALVLPLRSGAETFGSLSIYSVETDGFDPEEIGLLSGLAEDLAFGVQALRVRATRERAEAEVRRLLNEAEIGRSALLGILEDQKFAEEALQRSEERFRSAMLNSAIGLALGTPDGRWVEVNPALCRIVGYTREELIARDFQSITHPEDQAEDSSHYHRLLENETDTYELEKRYLHKDGRIVWVQLNVSLVRDAAGRPLHSISQIQDITERRRTAEDLRLSAQRLRLALVTSKLGIWELDLHTGETHWDERMFEIYRLDKGACPRTQADFFALIVPEDRDAVREAWAAMMERGPDYQVRFRVSLPGGVTRHIEAHATTQFDEFQQPKSVIGVDGDVTDIIDAVAESERLREQLLQSQKLKTLGQLAAGVAHDFNNLLTGINGFMDLAASSLPPGHEAADLLKRALSGAMNARDLVRRILNFSREGGPQPQSLLDLGVIVRETAPLISAALPSNVSLSVAIDPEAGWVTADSGQLQQILMNLCINGSHAIGAKAGTLRIGVDQKIFAPGAAISPPAGCGPGKYVVLSVTDSGSGMDEATRRRIFEPFFTTKSAGKGTGLGLSIVRDIVVAHHGGIEVESTPKVGSRFAVHLPATERENVPSPVTGVQAIERGAGQRILVVDDEPSVAMVLRLTLQRHGYSPEVYTSASNAWRRFAHTPTEFDLIVVDHNMPDMDGTEFVHRARAVSGSVPILLISGLFERSGAAHNLGVDGVFTLKKPFETDDLIIAVGESLRPANHLKVAIGARDPL